MNAPFELPLQCPIPGADHLAGLIDTHTKQLVIDAYSYHLCTEELAIQLIHEHGLKYA